MIIATTSEGQLLEQYKFTCIQCLNGHRSGTCTHFSRIEDPDELVFFIDKRGRPKKSEPNLIVNSFYPNEIQFILSRAELHPSEKIYCSRSLKSNNPIFRHRCSKPCCLSCKNSNRIVRFLIDSAVIAPVFPDKTIGDYAPIEYYLSDYNTPIEVPDNRKSIASIYEAKCSVKSSKASSSSHQHQLMKPKSVFRQARSDTRLPKSNYSFSKSHLNISREGSISPKSRSQLSLDFDPIDFEKDVEDLTGVNEEASNLKVNDIHANNELIEENTIIIDYSNINPLINMNFTPKNDSTVPSTLSQPEFSFDSNHEQNIFDNNQNYEPFVTLTSGFAVLQDFINLGQYNYNNEQSIDSKLTLENCSESSTSALQALVNPENDPVMFGTSFDSGWLTGI